MLNPTWKVQRQLTQKRDALYRWDQFYQYLLPITLSQEDDFLSQSEAELPEASQPGQEVSNEPGALSKSFYFSANPVPDH